METMWPTKFHARLLLLLTLSVVEGVQHTQKLEAHADGHVVISVEADGQLAQDGDANGKDGLLRRERNWPSGSSSLGEGVAFVVEDPKNDSAAQISASHMPKQPDVNISAKPDALTTPRSGAIGAHKVSDKTTMRCGWTEFAPEDPCPTECPLLAEESWNACHFQCVSEESCGVLDPKATVADYKQGRCRPCFIAGCDKCSLSGKDRCHTCMLGYILDDSGECFSAGRYIWTFVSTCGLQIITVIFLWLVELCMRRPTNLKGLRHGTKFRKRTRCHMPLHTPPHLGVADPDDSAGLLYPMTTNLLVTPIGGPACCLHFGFQAYTIVWGAVFCLSWAYCATVCGYDLLKVGTLPAHTPQELCSVIRWGAKRQQAMFAYKFYFVISIYGFQFLSCIAFAIFQQYRFSQLDNHATMKDFACFIYGLPVRTGVEDVEGLFKDWLSRETGQKVLGVSVAWNLMKRNDVEEVEAALEAEAAVQEKEHLELKIKDGQEPEEEEVVLPLALTTKAFGLIDRAFGYDGKEPEEPPAVDAAKMRELLEKMKTSDVAFAVFETEGARDAAVALAQEKKGFVYDKRIVRLETKACEPGSVRWYGLSLGSKTRRRHMKMIGGVGIMLGMLVVWSVVFYLPYAYYVSAFTYANGNEPGFTANMVFTLLVVIGNGVMYATANAVSVWCDFGFEDDREYWYNVYYLCASVMNVLADMVVTGYTAYWAMVAVGVHTADGQLLGSLTSFQKIIESYPMQKSLGTALFTYCFSGTFLMPFLIEPVVSVYAPWFMARLLLRNHKEVQGRGAEKAMAFGAPMSLSRYSDLILNMTLAVMVLFLPGGFVMRMFLALVISHIYIYAMDHWRVLRAVPNFSYAKKTCDQFAMTWMALPCALTLTAAVCKGYRVYWPELNGACLACVMSWAFFGHIFLHVIIIRIIYAREWAHKSATETYDEIAKHCPNTWFSVNPVHCLRSKYVCKHEPAQVYHITGKEHLQRENPKIHSYFEDKAAQKAEVVTKSKLNQKGSTDSATAEKGSREKNKVPSSAPPPNNKVPSSAPPPPEKARNPLEQLVLGGKVAKNEPPPVEEVAKDEPKPAEEVAKDEPPPTGKAAQDEAPPAEDVAKDEPPPAEETAKPKGASRSSPASKK